MFTNAKKTAVNIFLAGLLVTLPLAISLFIIKFLFTTIDEILGPVITQLLILGGAPIASGYRVPGLGVMGTLVLVFAVGLFTRNYLGQRLLKSVDNLLQKIPGFNKIYVAAKQVIDTFSASSSTAFKKVAMIEYPRSGIYTLAFITYEGASEMSRRTGREMVNLYVPTTPNPTSGFFLALPKDAVTELDMSVEDGFKIVISCGLIVPPDKVVEKGTGGTPFHNMVVDSPVSPEILRRLAAGHHGVVKVVVDVRKRKVAAGGEWHTDSLALLKEGGSDPADCWGAKYNIETGEISYKSQINQNRPTNRLDEISDETIRKTVSEMVRKYLEPATYPR